VTRPRWDRSTVNGKEARATALTAAYEARVNPDRLIWPTGFSGASVAVRTGAGAYRRNGRPCAEVWHARSVTDGWPKAGVRGLLQRPT
jgi:hypothetical protein